MATSTSTQPNQVPSFPSYTPTASKYPNVPSLAQWTTKKSSASSRTPPSSLSLPLITPSNPSGYGYQVRIVSDLPNLDNDLAASLEWGLSEISKIQKAARTGNPIIKPRWPMLVLRTPKGLSGPKIVHGEFIEGSFRSHQVPLPAAKTDPEELGALKEWLGSYRPHHLFDLQGKGGPVEEMLSLIPVNNEKKMGQRKESYKSHQPLSTPDWMRYCVQKGTQESCMKAIGRFLKEVVKE
jgi:xylulose-5-phosphate/fructose-6-phosphate phosphoketolase